jgi:GNAT superfamily N-acetyltransferase
MSSELRVRRAVAADAASVGRLVADLGTLRQATARPALPALKRELGRRSSPVLLALKNGRVVGLLRFHLLHALAHNGRRWALLEDLIVDARARGQGVGELLLAQALLRAKRMGCYKISLASRLGRHSAHALYKKAGFEKFGHGFRRLL